MNVKGVTHGPGPMFASKVENRPKKRFPLKAPEIICSSSNIADKIISQVLGPIISTISKRLKMDTWRSDAIYKCKIV